MKDNSCLHYATYIGRLFHYLISPRSCSMQYICILYAPASTNDIASCILTCTGIVTVARLPDSQSRVWSPQLRLLHNRRRRLWPTSLVAVPQAEDEMKCHIKWQWPSTVNCDTHTDVISMGVMKQPCCHTTDCWSWCVCVVCVCVCVCVCACVVCVCVRVCVCVFTWCLEEWLSGQRTQYKIRIKHVDLNIIQEQFGFLHTCYCCCCCCC